MSDFWFCSDVKDRPMQSIIDCIEVAVEEGFLSEDDQRLLELYLMKLINNCSDSSLFDHDFMFTL